MKIEKGTKLILKNTKGLCDKPQEKRIDFLDKIVTIKKVYYYDDGTIDTFFIEEDMGFFEWTTEEIKEIIN